MRLFPKAASVAANALASPEISLGKKRGNIL